MHWLIVNDDDDKDGDDDDDDDDDKMTMINMMMMMMQYMQGMLSLLIYWRRRLQWACYKISNVKLSHLRTRQNSQVKSNMWVMG